MKFETGAIAGLLTEGILIILIPIILLIVWKKKSGAALKPAITGMIIFPVFGVLLKLIPSYFLLIADNPLSRAINGNVWLYHLIGGGLLAGIFEEGGRFFAFKTILKNNTDKKDAISYGIGHGGIESIYLGFSAALSFALMGIIINTNGIESITAGLDPITAETAIAPLSAYSTSPFYVPAVLGTLERITAIILHTSLSVFVFTAANKKGYGYLFPLAIVLHTLMNFSSVFYNTGMISVAVLEIFMLIYALIVAFFAKKLLKLHDQVTR